MKPFEWYGSWIRFGSECLFQAFLLQARVYCGSLWSLFTMIKPMKHCFMWLSKSMKMLLWIVRQLMLPNVTEMLIFKFYWKICYRNQTVIFVIIKVLYFNMRVTITLSYVEKNYIENRNKYLTFWWKIAGVVFSYRKTSMLAIL